MHPSLDSVVYDACLELAVASDHVHTNYYPPLLSLFLSLSPLALFPFPYLCIFQEYGRLHEILALVPPFTPLLACTATVTKSVCDEIINSLEMEGCEIISKSPDRPNSFYKVLRSTDMETDLNPYLESLKQLRVKSPRTIIYCRSLNVCSELYAYFLYELGEKAYYPDGADKVSNNRLLGFYAHTLEYKVILKSSS